MEQYDHEVLSKVENARNAIIPESTINDVLNQYLLDLEKEDKEFYEQFNKAIDDPSLIHADDAYSKEFGVEDSYLGMKLGLPRGPDNELQHAKVKRRAVDVEG